VILARSGPARVAAQLAVVERSRFMKTLSAGFALLAFWVSGKADAQGAREIFVERIEQINLTEDQETKVGAIQKEFRPKVEEAAKELTTLAKEEVEKIRGVLTPEQKTKAEALKEERKERRTEGLSERAAHLDDFDLTEGEAAKIMEIRKEYRPKVAKALEGLKGTLTAEQSAARDEALKAGKKHREVVASLNLTAEQKEKVETVCKDVVAIVREEMEKIREVLSKEQQEKLQEIKEERPEQVRDRMAHRIANLKDLELTDQQRAQIMEIRKEFRPKVHDAGNKLRGLVRDELEQIVSVIKA
jgi:Spy/CpxP family protein refolding chaperone